MSRLFKQLETVLGSRPLRTIDVPAFRRAGVLVPILERANGPTLLFTRRTETVSHPGQISFPGGHFLPGEDARMAALREAEEEIALPRDSVAVAGLMDDLLSIRKVIVTPVVGVVDKPPHTFVRQESEVSEPFEVPLRRLVDPRFYREEHWDARQIPPGWSAEEASELREQFFKLDPETYTFPVSFYDGGEGRVIWGLTAQILKQLLGLLA